MSGFITKTLKNNIKICSFVGEIPLFKQGNILKAKIEKLNSIETYTEIPIQDTKLEQQQFEPLSETIPAKTIID